MVPPASGSLSETMSVNGSSTANFLPIRGGNTHSSNTNSNNSSLVDSCMYEQQDLSDEKRTYIARLILRIQRCLEQLGVDVTDEEVNSKIESMSILIHESMSISSRNYHSVQHVFDISKDLEDPVAILAALFHDCVYYHVDGGLSHIQSTKLEGAIVGTPEKDGTSVLKTNAEPGSDKLLQMVMVIFGLEPGQVMTPSTGLNEFLSAVIAVRELKDILSIQRLAEITCCVEATIPFRASTKEYGTAMDRLYRNMIKVNTELNLGMSADEELVSAVQRAVLMANEDIGNFGTEDLWWFLDNTWSLLPESNAALRHQYLYTVFEFQFAVFKMNGFFSFLKPDIIFQQFRGVPSDETIAFRLRNATRNLEEGRKYVGAKLLSVSLLAAFAELTGGDAPISLFMGDLPSRHRISRRLEDTLPDPPMQQLQNCNKDVYNLLLKGRRREMAFDVKKSPLAAFLYAFLGDEGLQKILRDVKVYPMTPETAMQLLSSLPRTAVILVAENMKMLALSRTELIHQVIESLPPVEGGE